MDFTYLPFAPNENTSEILEAGLYANKLKENELLQAGIDVDKMKEEDKNQQIQLNPILSKFYESKEKSEKDFHADKLKESFFKFEVRMKLVFF